MKIYMKCPNFDEIYELSKKAHQKYLDKKELINNVILTLFFIIPNKGFNA